MINSLLDQAMLCKPFRGVEVQLCHISYTERSLELCT